MNSLHWSSFLRSTGRVPSWNPSLLQDEFEELSQIERLAVEILVNKQKKYFTVNHQAQILNQPTGTQT